MSLMSTLWSWIYYGSGFIVGWYGISIIWKSIKRTPMQRIKFIEKAVANNCTTLAKVSSYVTYGTTPMKHEVEYAYKVDDKMYFATYLIHKADEEPKPEDEYQPGNCMAIHIPATSIIYYDKNNPAKSVMKNEVFAEREFMLRIKTPKKNPFRDIYKDWTGPIER